MAHFLTKFAKLWRPDTIADKIDSQKMFIDNVVQEESNFLDLSKRINKQVATIAELKAIDTTDISLYVDGMVCVCLENKLIYIFHRSASDTNNNRTVIAPTTGGGRWKSADAGGGISNSVYVETSSSTTTRTITIPNVTDYTQLVNVPLIIKSAAAGSTSSTLNVNGFGAKTIYFPTATGTMTTSTTANWVANGGIYVVVYNGTYFYVNDIVIPNASTSVSGRVQLSDDVDSTSTTMAATPNAVRRAYEAATSGGSVAGAVYTETSISPTVRTVTVPNITSYTQLTNVPLTIRSRAIGTTGITTLNVNGLGAKDICIKSPLGVITTEFTYYGWTTGNSIYTVVYDGYSFYVTNVESYRVYDKIMNEDTGSAGTRNITIFGLTSYNDILNIPITIRSKYAGVAGSVSLNIGTIGYTNLRFPQSNGTMSTTAPANWITVDGLYTVVYNGTYFDVVDMQSVPEILSNKVYDETSTSSQTHTVTIPNVTNYTQLTNIPITIRAKANGGTSGTLNINNLGAKSLYHLQFNGTMYTLSSPDWVVIDGLYTVVYNGTNFYVTGNKPSTYTVYTETSTSSTVRAISIPNITNAYTVLIDMPIMIRSKAVGVAATTSLIINSFSAYPLYFPKSDGYVTNIPQPGWVAIDSVYIVVFNGSAFYVVGMQPTVSESTFTINTSTVWDANRIAAITMSGVTTTTTGYITMPNNATIAQKRMIKLASFEVDSVTANTINIKCNGPYPTAAINLIFVKVG